MEIHGKDEGATPSPQRKKRVEGEEEEDLRWGAVEKLPAHPPLSTAILKSYPEAGDSKQRRLVYKEVDVRKLSDEEKQDFIDRVFKVPEDDNEIFLRKLRRTIDRQGIELPTVEIRFEHLAIEADCYFGTRALPTLLNATRNLAESLLSLVGIQQGRKTKLSILRDVSGIIKPARLTLLLGPPSSGKTTLLCALAGKLEPSLKVKGQVTYNGHRFDEFVPQKTSIYVGQTDVHLGEMTVKETLDFSSRCQGVGSRRDLLEELVRREKAAEITPDVDVDLFVKAISAPGLETSLQTDYTLRILGLDVCKDTVVGDEMRRGVSGGQKKRVTTGEMIVGPAKVMLMDDISTGLDSSTTYQIVKCLRQNAHFTQSTIFMSLLHPDPETFHLFDDIVLLAEGQIVYQGPREHVLDFFQSCGFECPERKGAADFLQEVISRKDQQQYWAKKDELYRYIPVSEFAALFGNSHLGQQLRNELSIPYDKSKSPKGALAFTKYTLPIMDLLKATFTKEWLLIQRNAFVYISKCIQIMIAALTASTVFLPSRNHTRSEADGSLYIGMLMFALYINLFNGFVEVTFTISRLPVFYKQRDLLFYPAWAFTLPNFLLKIPITLIESSVWVLATYFIEGFAPDGGRFFKQFLVIFLVQQMAAGLFRLIAGVCRTMTTAKAGGSLVLLIVLTLGGVLIPRGYVPKWWVWGYWASPLSYAYNAISVNEMLAPRWARRVGSERAITLGVAVLENFDVFPHERWFWIGTLALVGFTVLFNVLFTLALMYLNPIGRPQAVMPVGGLEASPDESNEEAMSRKIESARGENGTNGRGGGEAIHTTEPTSEAGTTPAPRRGLVLPFTPLTMSFSDVNYYIDMPREMKGQGEKTDKLQLLKGVTAAFRPGVLTALMGVSGAGKTTLMDVLAGRKTRGYVEGDIRISGFPKVQDTFARVSGYCEQTDIHSPHVTVKESLIYSAFLRLPKEVNLAEKFAFVEEVMELVELDSLQDAIVGIPGVSGLSTEQRKRLTIAVELVANPSIIFMDEPTTGLDARSAAIVMRTVRNTVDTGRTIVCTIHQPSIDVFEAFDEVLLMKTGGQLIYSGPLGRNSCKVIEYFQAISGVPKMKRSNPATWMLDVSSSATEARLGIDFVEYYRSSPLYQRNKELVEELSTPAPGAEALHFETKYSESSYCQFKSCLWKQWLSYWRSPDYNLVRYLFTLVAALMIGTVFWKIGRQRESANDLTIIIGAMYSALLFVGINNCATVQPVIAMERTAFYRERAAGMYSALPYALAQVLVEIPYTLVQTTYYTLIVYAMVGFEWTAVKFFWFFFITFFTFLYFTYYGMMTVSLTPNHQIAAIFAAGFYALFNLFSGYFIPRPKIPGWWVWYYWICPVAWTVYGLIVSQYSDIETTITVPGAPDQSIKSYIEIQFGYRSDFMGPVAVVLMGFAVFFALVYAYCIKKINFQHR